MIKKRSNVLGRVGKATLRITIQPLHSGKGYLVEIYDPVTLADHNIIIDKNLTVLTTTTQDSQLLDTAKSVVLNTMKKKK